MILPSLSRLLTVVLGSACLLGGISGCALMKRPQPSTAIGLPPVAATDWPEGVEPGLVAADSGLRSDRVVVVDGAIRMQYEGLRWIDAPAVLLAEQLRQRRARAGGERDPAAAQLDLQLTAFQLRVAPGLRRVEVAASAVLVCGQGPVTRYLTPVSIEIESPAEDAATLAEVFAQASASLMDDLLAQASAQQTGCAAEASRAPTQP
jgi:hypothetical protein